MLSVRNQVQLIGHLGTDPTIKNFGNSNQLATVSMATTDRYFSKGEWHDDTQWHRLVMWDKLAERAESYLRKGSYVMVQGKLEHRTYEDKNGHMRYITEIRVQNFISFDKKNYNNEIVNSQVEEDGFEETHAIDYEDNLPF